MQPRVPIDTGSLAATTEVAATLGEVRQRRRGIVIAAIVSAALHLVVFGAILGNWLSAPKGGGGQLLDAIEIEVIDTDSRESTAAAIAHAGGRQAMPGPTSVDAPTDNTAAAAASAAKPPPANVDAADRTPKEVVGETAATTQSTPTLRDAQSEPPHITIEVETKPSFAASAAAAPSGASAVAISESVVAASAATAAPGVADRYRLAVRKALSRRPPRPNLPAGTAVAGIALIAFSVTATGTVENAELLESTRNPRLNQILLGWIAASNLPAPPPGLTAAERRFSIPYTVR